MFFAHRTKQRLRVALAVGVSYALMVGIVAAAFPRVGKNFVSSFGWWMLVIPTGLVAYATIELFGTWGLGLHFWQRMPTWVRVPFLVVTVCLCVVVVAFAGQYFGVGFVL